MGWEFYTEGKKSTHKYKGTYMKRKRGLFVYKTFTNPAASSKRIEIEGKQPKWEDLPASQLLFGTNVEAALLQTMVPKDMVLEQGFKCSCNK